LNWAFMIYPCEFLSAACVFFFRNLGFFFPFMVFFFFFFLEMCPNVTNHSFWAALQIPFV